MSSSSYVFFLLSLLVFLVVLPSMVSCVHESASPQGPLKVKLVHIDSPASPYRRKYDSPEHRDKILTQLAAARLLEIYHLLLLAAQQQEETDIGPPPYRLPLSLDPAAVFLASLGMGTPIADQLLAVDTGSSITWVTCIGSRFQAGNYAYMHSATYMPVTCADPDCVPIGAHCAYPTDKCQFTFQYRSIEEPVTGFFVKDALIFSENQMSVPNMMFGCGFPSAPIKQDFTGPGVMGLSNHPVSMATQFGSVFSYCIGNMHDPSYGFNTLFLSQGLLLGNSTPILNIISKIFVKLQSITVGGEVLDINPIIFDLDISFGGTVMDSGSAKTLLADDAYYVLRDKLQQIMAPASAAMCFYDLQPSQVPEVQFIFEQGAKLTLGMEALFSPGQSSPNVQCFNGIKPTSVSLESREARNMTLIGINAQQFHNIGFDYNAGRLYISKTECRDLLPL